MGRHPGLLPFGNSAFGTPHHTTPHHTTPHNLSCALLFSAAQGCNEVQGRPADAYLSRHLQCLSLSQQLLRRHKVLLLLWELKLLLGPPLEREVVRELGVQLEPEGYWCQRGTQQH